MKVLPANKVLCILYSSGGTADVGRHAVQVALDRYDGPIRVLTSDPETTLLTETNWNCACPHKIDRNDRRLDIRKVDVVKEDLTPHLENVGSVISGLGNRQPFYGDCVGHEGTANLMKAMKHHQITRLVSITSVGCNEDYPPMEFHWAGGILKWIFILLARKPYRDLCQTEDAIRKNEYTTDYLLVRPVGLGEDRPPVNEWVVQTKKYQDKLGPDMSKLDCAHFCVQEAVEPTYHSTAVVIGSDFDTFEMNPKKKEESEE